MLLNSVAYLRVEETQGGTIETIVLLLEIQLASHSIRIRLRANEIV